MIDVTDGSKKLATSALKDMSVCIYPTRVLLPSQFKFSHVDVQLGIFIPHTTEVDIRWFVSDLEPKLSLEIENHEWYHQEMLSPDGSRILSLRSCLFKVLEKY